MISYSLSGTKCSCYPRRANTMFLQQPAFFSILLTILAIISGVSCSQPQYYSDHAYCPSYCTANNKYQSSFECKNFPYCCGDRNTRYCCANKSLSIGNDYSDVCYACSSTPCGFFNEWSTILMSTAVVVFAGLVTACFCHCYVTNSDKIHCHCFKKCWSRSVRTLPSSSNHNVSSNNRSSSRRRARRHHRNHHTESVVVPAELSDFNPNHRFALRPPEYDNLPIINSEPPKYDEIINQLPASGSSENETNSSAVNPAYEADDGGNLRPSSTEDSNHSPRSLPTTANGSGFVVRIDALSATALVDENRTFPPTYEVAISMSDAN